MSSQIRPKSSFMKRKSSKGQVVRDQLSCRYHPNTVLIEDHAAGDMVCPDCGLVVGDRVIDVGSEWRTFASDEGKKDKSRVGGAEDPLLGDSNLTTVIAAPDGKTGLDENGNSIYKNRPQISAEQRALRAAFTKIQDMVDRINGTTVVADHAKLYFKQVYTSRRVKTHLDAVAAACLFIACRKEGVARTFKELCAISGTDVKVMGRYYYKIRPIIGAGVGLQPSIVDFIPRFCSQLDLPAFMVEVVTHVAKAAVQIDVFARRSPTSVVAGAIFLVCKKAGLETTSQEVAEVSGAADVTVRQVFKEMLTRVRHLYPAASARPSRVFRR